MHAHAVPINRCLIETLNVEKIITYFVLRTIYVYIPSYIIWICTAEAR